MIETILTKIGALILTPIVFLSTFFVQPVQAPVVQDDSLGVALPSGTALFETSLASPITGSASSLTLVANSVRGGGTLSGYQCFTIDEGSAQAEYVCGTVSGTSVTSLERGLSPSDGITQTASLQFSHRRGSSVKITDFPLIQRLKSQASGTGTYENVLTYAAGVTPTNSGDLADREYVLSVITGTSTISYDKHVIQGTAGETMATGTIVYLRASDSRWYKADNDLTETYVDQNLGIAQGPGTSGSSIPGGVLTYGLDSTQKALTPGGFVFLSATAGATSTATTSQVLGKAISATTMFFDQNLIDSSVYVPTTFVATTTFTGTSTFTNAVIGIGSTTIRFLTTTGSTTYSKPVSPTFKYAVVEVLGAGGDGANDGAGGGAGGYSKKVFASNQLSSSTNLFIGTAGVGTGNTCFGSLCVGNGADASTVTGGTGGTATGGDINLTGQNGQNSPGSLGGGAGGSSPYGQGGRYVYNTSITSTLSGENAAGYGSGGSGGQQASDSSPSGGSGAIGVQGLIVITEYF